ncbi:hypothetical protein BV898_16028 [Hypsibius exemplaris]|uniref:SET domain-containing protein n=1 Tax=Hypsibius exemplaris TaxID=2072580 RepID=A0A9X6NL82_HYPEX|nr:hypothetical protein BV898_16028 [Hypsibius exemplaris]
MELKHFFHLDVESGVSTKIIGSRVPAPTKPGAWNDFIQLFSLDDPEAWQPPDGPVIAPPSHIEAVIRRRKLWQQDENFKPVVGVAGRGAGGGLLNAKNSEFNLRKDFFKLNHPKNLHHSERLLTFPREHAAERLAGDEVEFMRGKDQGWFQLKKTFNPEVFECMADYIVPLENFEFYAALEVLLSCLHNSQLVMRVTSKEDLVEIWSRDFAKKLQEVISVRPSTFHTIVIPLILKSVRKNFAMHLIQKEWNRTSIFSCCFPAASIYARTVNRWILPLTEAFEDGLNGRLKKPTNRKVRLDLGYLFHQRRLAGRKSNRHIENDTNQKRISVGQYYNVVHRLNPGRRLSDHKKFLVPFGNSSVVKTRTSGSSQQQHKSSASSQRQHNKQSASSNRRQPSASQPHHNSIANQRGSLRSAAVKGNQSMISVRKPKFNLERLLKANNKKARLERVYWLQPMRAGRQQPPKVFAKLQNVNQTDDQRALSEMRDEFLNHYLPFAHRELFKEARLDPSLIYPQYESCTIRAMMGDEIAAEFSDAANKIRYGKAAVKELRKPYIERKNRVNAASNEIEQKLAGAIPETKIRSGQEDPLLGLKRNGNASRRSSYLHALDKENVPSDEEMSDEEAANAYSPKKAKVRQLVGNNSLDVLKHWSVLSLELANDNGPFISPKPDGKAATQISQAKIKSEVEILAGLIVPRPQNATNSFVTTAMSADTVKGGEVAPLTTREVMLDTDKDPMEDESLFLRLVIDSGHNYFYFDIGGDSDEEEEEPKPVEEMNESQDVIDAARRRRQSSLAVEGMNKWNFNYLDQGDLKKVAATFEHLKGAEQDAKQWEITERDSVIDEIFSDIHVEEVPFRIIPPEPIYPDTQKQKDNDNRDFLEREISRKALAQQQSGLSLGATLSVSGANSEEFIPSQEQFFSAVANEPLVDRGFGTSLLAANKDSGDEQEPVVPAFMAGSQIMVNSPWVWALDPMNSGHFCEHCFQPLKATGSEFFRTLSRRDRCVYLAMMLAAEGKTKEAVPAQPNTERTWDQLISHWEVFQQRPDFVLGVQQLQGRIQTLLGEELFEQEKDRFSCDAVGTALARFAINSFTITDKTACEVGCGIYLSGSVFDHSCCPNAARFFTGKELHVYALDAIKDFEETDEHRKRDLKRCYCFDCHCNTCTHSVEEGSPSTRLSDSEEQVMEQAIADLNKASKSSDKEKFKSALELANTTIHAASRNLPPANRRQMTGLHEHIAEALQMTGDYNAATLHFARVLHFYTLTYPEGSIEIFTITLKWLSCAALADQQNRTETYSIASSKSRTEMTSFHIAAVELLNRESKRFLGVQFVPLRLVRFFTGKRRANNLADRFADIFAATKLRDLFVILNASLHRAT